MDSSNVRTVGSSWAGVYSMAFGWLEAGEGADGSRVARAWNSTSAPASEDAHLTVSCVGITKGDSTAVGEGPILY